MQSINTLSLTSAVNNWLANSSQPRILHVFDQACNLINERSEVLSIVTSQIGNGPFNLVIEDDVLFSDHLHAQSPISIRANELILGRLTIDTSSARLWSPCPDWEMLHAERDNILNQLALLQIPDNQPLLPNSLLSTLSNAVASADVSSARTVTSKLAGLGAGLTPAGDDFLLGAIYAAWIIHPLEIASVLVKEIANTAAPLTTSLSAAWLRAGARGEAGALWHDFFNAMLMANSATIQLQVAKLLSVGHTSGLDTFAGFLGSFVSWSNVKGQ